MEGRKRRSMGEERKFGEVGEVGVKRREENGGEVEGIRERMKLN